MCFYPRMSRLPPSRSLPLRILWRAFAAAPPAPPLHDPPRIARLYRYFRVRVLYASFIGYALSYFCRKNFSTALPAIGHDLHFSNTQLGDLDLILYLTYGVGKFTNGILGDHLRPGPLIALGLVSSALCNVWFGLSSSLALLAFVWGLNGWAQSMCFPPCARLLANWYSRSERGSFWGLWNISHQVGGMLIAVLAGALTEHYGWRAAFFVPAAFCAMGAVLMLERLPDVPSSLGLPGIARYRQDPELSADGSELTEEPESIRQVLFHRVLNNPNIWLLSLMNLFVYIVRSGAFDWSTKFLVEVKGQRIGNAGFITGSFEALGIGGALLSGVISDRVNKGRRAPMCFAFLMLSLVGLLAFYRVPPGHPVWAGAALGLTGFAIYGPQFLIGVFATDLASPKAAATAIGLTGIFGYAGSALSAGVTGRVIDRYGWRGGFLYLGAAALLGALVALFLWNVRPPGPGQK